jgi:hypothetical protein
MIKVTRAFLMDILNISKGELSLLESLGYLPEPVELIYDALPETPRKRKLYDIKEFTKKLNEGPELLQEYAEILESWSGY